MDTVNSVNVGDTVYFNFVFDSPDSSGVVVEIDNGRYLVEDHDHYRGKDVVIGWSGTNSLLRKNWILANTGIDNVQKIR